MIVVIDYNVGNVRSVCNAFRSIGCEIKLSREPAAVEAAAGHSDFKTTRQSYLAAADDLKERARRTNARGIWQKLVR
jgi:hypothetical protein